MDTPPPAASPIRLEYNSIPSRRGRFYPRGRPRLAAGIGLAGLLWALADESDRRMVDTRALAALGLMAAGLILLVLAFIPLGRRTGWGGVLLTVGIYIASGVLFVLLVEAQAGVCFRVWWSEDKLAAEAERMLVQQRATTLPIRGYFGAGRKFGLVKVRWAEEVDGAVFFGTHGQFFIDNGLLYVPPGVSVPGPKSAIYNLRHLWGPWYSCSFYFD